LIVKPSSFGFIPSIVWASHVPTHTNRYRQHFFSRFW
jgi:hypothetical protein